MRKRASGWLDDELLSVAEKFHIDHMTIEEIGKELHTSRQTVSRMIRAAEHEGMVRVIVAPRGDYQDLRDLEDAIRDRFPWIRDVILVPGHPGILKGFVNPVVRDGIVYTMAEAAAKYLERQLKGVDKVAVSSGDVIKRTINGVRLADPLPDLRIFPLQGSFGKKHYKTDANVIAADFQRVSCGKSFWLPIPAVATSQSDFDVFCALPQVKNTLNLLRRSELVIVGIGALTTRKLWYTRRVGSSTREQIRNLRTAQDDLNPPVGEIGGRIYRRDGSEFDAGWKVMGLGLSEMRELVEQDRGKVVAVAGGDPERIEAIASAIRGKVINCLITDHVTARQLLTCG